VAVDDAYQPHILFVVLGSVIIFLASVCLALWIFSNTRRISSFNQMKAQSEAEKALLILDNARQATKAERELNDFIAHEVRNPVAAAMAACSFGKTAICKEEPLADAESIQTTREDVNVIESALRFVNDLLRNMLDMHRAADKQLQVNMAPCSILHDVLEPVHAMLHKRGDKVQVLVECPPNICVKTDCLRLKQIMLNLGRNSSKFVNEGFIRLRGEVIDGQVRLSVEDSGSGIPLEKRVRLFAKFQESLDVLSQGTVRIFVSGLWLNLGHSHISSFFRALACFCARI
jgi:signal transduction histidine kinase